jgi:hypothetical protein
MRKNRSGSGLSNNILRERKTMAKRSPLTPNEKNLIRRYLTWCYKTTKEELDKIDRYFTQIKADEVILKQLKKTKEEKSSAENKASEDTVDRFQAYMKNKEENALKKKFKDGKSGAWHPEYQYLHHRFMAIEHAIRHFLGADELKKISFLYEQEMTRRILEAREHT